MTEPRRCRFCTRPLRPSAGQDAQRLFCDFRCASGNSRLPLVDCEIVTRGVRLWVRASGGPMRPLSPIVLTAWTRAGYAKRTLDRLWLTEAGRAYVRERRARAA